MLLFLDIETSGFDPENAALLELSAVRFDGKKVVAQFDELVHPEYVDHIIPPIVQKLTGITSALLVNAPPLEEVRVSFLENFLQPTDIIVGHNISFDTGFLRAKGFEFANAEIDTYPLTTILLPQEESHSLEILTAKYGLLHENKHRALGDVTANLELWKLLQNIFQEDFSPELKERYRSVLEKSGWTGKNFFLDAALVEEKNKTPQLPLLENNGSGVSNARNFSAEKTLHEKEFQDSVRKIFAEKTKVLWETPPDFPTDFFHLALESAGEWATVTAEKKLGICVSPAQENGIVEILKAFQLRFPALRSGQLFLPENVVCGKRWLEFLEKPLFSDAETVVALKILRDMEKESYGAPNLKHDEWPVWLQVSSSTHAECPVDCPARKYSSEEIWKHFDVLFFPHRLFKYFSGENLLLSGAEDAEDLWTRFGEEKVGSRELRGLLPGLPEVQEKGEFLIGYLGGFLRKEAGENPYPVDVAWEATRGKEWLELAQGFSEFLKEVRFRTPQNDRLCHVLEKWVLFFTEIPDRAHLRFWKIFPDDEVEGISTPVKLEETVSIALQKYESALFLGWPFPKKDRETWAFPFSWPKEIALKSLPASSNNRLQNPVFFPAAPEISPDDFSLLATWLTEIGTHTCGNTLAIFSSLKAIEAMEKYFLSLSRPSFSFFTPRSGSMGKVRYFLQTQEGKKLLCATPHFLDRLFPMENISFSTVFFQKFMFDPPGNLLLSERKKHWNNAFGEYVLPRSLTRFQKDLFRLQAWQTEPYRFFCCDQRLGANTPLGNSFREMLPLNSTYKALAFDEIVDEFSSF